MIAGDRRSVGGFTLIELLVTIAVVAIIATVAVPNFSRFVERNRLAAEFNEILTGLHYARSEAVKRRQVVTAAITVDESGAWVMQVQANGEVIRELASRGANVEVASGVVEFNSLGRRGANCTFSSCVISLDGQGIEINAAGNISRHQP